MSANDVTKRTGLFGLLMLAILLTLSSVGNAHAQKRVPAGKDTAGFSFSTASPVSQSKANQSHASQPQVGEGVTLIPFEPVIHYQLNIDMLAGIDDRPTMSVFGDGRVEVHYPLYMKKAGDYVMQLGEDELVELIQSLSANGVLEFDDRKVKKNIRDKKNQQRAKGQFHAVSDAVVTIIDVRLDEYQKNSLTSPVKKFHKQFKWANIEHDARRYPKERDIVDASQSVQRLRSLMKDFRLERRR